MARKSKGKKESQWVSVASLIEGETKDDNDYIRVSQDYKPKKGKAFTAPGRLLYEDFDTGNVYELSTLSMFEPHENAPDFISDNLAINLLNENQCTDVSDEFEGVEEEPEEEEPKRGKRKR